MSSPEPRPVLLLDVMDTLVHDPYHREQPAFFGLALDQLQALKHPTAWIDFELGRITEEEFLRRFFRDGRPFDHLAFRQHVAASYRWIDGMEELLAELVAEGFEAHALSNYPVWYRLIEEKLRLSRYLAWSFVSCRTGVRKPEPASYLGAARSLGLYPSQCLVVDDRPANVAGARQSGMAAILFEGADALRQELDRRGILTALQTKS
ncbi:MAG: HAD family phosphatase [Acidobacteriota bacterium]|nr:HAD family phosphatase [Acidobacteriota bacterium]